MRRAAVRHRDHARQCLVRSRRQAGEQPGENIPHGVQMRQRRRGKRRSRRIAQKNSEQLQPRRRCWQTMGLPVRHHLQAMLSLPQENIRAGQRAQIRFRQMRLRRLGPQRRQRSLHTQRRVAPGPHQLQRLRAEFDFAYAAFAEFQIVAEQLRWPIAAAEPRALMRIHALLHGVDIRHGREIQVAPPHERPHLFEEQPPQREIARHRPRLDQRRAFPGLAERLVIRQRRRQRDARRRAAGIRPQPQIDAENISPRIPRLHKTGQVTRHAGKHRPRFRLRMGCRVVQKDQVHIARKVKFARAKLAHGQNHEAAAAFGRGGVRQPDLPTRMGGQQQMTAHRPQRAVGQIGQCAGHLGQIPLAADIAYRRGQRHGALGMSQRRRQLRPRQPGLQPPQRAERLVAHRVRAGGHDGEQRFRLAQCELSQIGAVAAQAFQQAARYSGAGVRAGLGHEIGHEPGSGGRIARLRIGVAHEASRGRAPPRVKTPIRPRAC